MYKRQDLDITTFAPLSVKTSLDLHEILAEDTPAIWQSRPVAGGETGKSLREMVERAAALKAERLDQKPVSYTHLRAHETVLDLVCRLLLEKKKHTSTNAVRRM